MEVQYGIIVFKYSKLLLLSFKDDEEEILNELSDFLTSKCTVSNSYCR